MDHFGGIPPNRAPNPRALADYGCSGSNQERSLASRGAIAGTSLGKAHYDAGEFSMLVVIATEYPV
jgi:hypothetical protein